MGLAIAVALEEEREDRRVNNGHHVGTGVGGGLKEGKVHWKAQRVPEYMHNVRRKVSR